MKKTAIIGGGPAGMTAALSAAAAGDSVDLFEQNEKLGKKLYITGKGRCNLTNYCDLSDFFDQIVNNRNFMYSALYTFTNEQFMNLIESAGCPLKVERGERVFPKSDKSSDVIRAFECLLMDAGVNIHLNTKIHDLSIENTKEDIKPIVRGICLKNGEFRPYDKVVLATGGKSYPSTGSDGSGYHMAARVGHQVTPLFPSLTGIHTQETWARELQGLSLKNVGLTLKLGKKKILNQTGEMLFTHFGISGPMVLTASAYLKEPYENYIVTIDLKPALTPEQMEKRLQRDFEKYSNKNFSNALTDLLPSKMIPVMIKCSEIAPEKKVHQITRSERHRLAELFKTMTLYVTGVQDFNAAIITKGGIEVHEIDPSTMASKIVQGLYFAGEIIDVDALTGGFNIQIAASTGWLAGLDD